MSRPGPEPRAPMCEACCEAQPATALVERQKLLLCPPCYSRREQGK